MDIEIKGTVCQDSDAFYYEWYGESCTYPKKVIDKIHQANGEDLTVKVNSGGGNIFAASEIYTELKKYQGKVVIEIQGLAASAASVISMAGYCKMSPTALMMAHNVSTSVQGDHNDLSHEVEVLKTADTTIAAAYMAKTGMSEEEALAIMDKETWLNANEALNLGLIDEIMFNDAQQVNMMNNFDSRSYINERAKVPEDILKKCFSNVQNIERFEEKKKENTLSKFNYLKLGGIK